MKKILRNLVIATILCTITIFTSCQNPVGSEVESVTTADSRAVTAWVPGIYVAVGDVVSYNAKNYEVLIAHTTHGGWIPGPATYSIFKEVKGGGSGGQQPNTPVVELTLAEMSTYPNVIDEIDKTLLKYVSSGGGSGATSAYCTQIGVDNPAQSIKVSDELVFNADFEMPNGSPYNSDYKNIKGYIKFTDGMYIMGAFEKLNWSNNKASVSVKVDNINYSGSVQSMGFQFYERFEADLKVTNISYTISPSNKPVSEGKYGFPNRTNGHNKILNPAYIQTNYPELTQTAIEGDIQRLFEQWRVRYLVKADFPNAEGKIGKYIAYSGGVEHMPYDMNNPAKHMVPVTTSESHGFGMLILALMESGKNKTRADFDQMVDFYLQWKAHNDTKDHIMGWQVSKANADFSFTTVAYDEKNNYAEIEGPMISVTKDYLVITPKMWNNGDVIWGGADGAADGDMDIAYALLLADKQWGSNGRHNYLDIAKKAVAAIEKLYIADGNKSGHVLLANYHQAYDDYRNFDKVEYWQTRSSDMLMSHMGAFANVSTKPDTFNDAMHAIRKINYTQRESASGLFADFYYTTDQGVTWQAVPGKILESEYDGDYNWNACRTPWRVGTYLMESQVRNPFSVWGTMGSYNTFVKSKGGPKNLVTGYLMNGQPIPGRSTSENMAFAAPAFFATIASTDYTDAELLENYNYILDDSNATPDDPEGGKPYYGYYDRTIRLLTLITYSGNWLEAGNLR